LKRLDRKAHFEGVATHLGWLTVLGALVGGIVETDGLPWGVALLLVGAGLAAGAFRFRRFPLFAFGVIGAYVGLTRVLFEAGFDEILGCLWFVASGLGMVAFLVFAQRRLKEPA